MGLLGTGLYVALDARSVVAATLSRGPGRRRVEGFARRDLEPGALTPSPTGPNVVRREEVAEALKGVLGDLSPGRDRATVVLPDGIARLTVMSPPGGAEPRDYLKFRMTPSLPWPASEAIVDLLPAGRGRVVGAAVRRATVAQYEQVVNLAGPTVDGVHLAPLVALGGVLGRASRGQAATHLILGDVALCLALVWNGELVALRSRRRDTSEGEGARLMREAARTARLAGNGIDPSRLALSGAGAERLRDEMGDPGSLDGVRAALRGWPGAAEVAWLSGVLA